MSNVYQTVYDNAAALSFNSTFVEVASNTVRLKDLGGGTYTLTPQLVTSQARFAASDLSNFSDVEVPNVDTDVKYTFIVATTAYWYNSVAGRWEEADGTYAQSNTFAEIQPVITDFFTDLNLLVPQWIGLNVWLATTNASVRPVLSSTIITFEWENTTPGTINECLITANIVDLLGVVPTYDAARPAKLEIGADASFLHGSRFVLPFTKSAEFDSNGLAQLSIIETATPGIKLSFCVTFYDGFSKANSMMFKAFVPNQPTATINELTTVVPYDFG